jgi:hypothetical protein
MTSTLTVPATDKQVAFIVSLLAERNLDGVSWAFTIKSFNAWITDGKQTPCPVSKSTATEFIGALLKQPKKVVTSPPITTPKSKWQSIQQIGQVVPAAKYALERVDQPGAFDFFEVYKAKNTGNISVMRLTGSPTYWNKVWLGQTDQLTTIRRIARDAMSAAIAYAKEHGRCAVCNAHLSDPKSISQSMGPVCVKKFS